MDARLPGSESTADARARSYIVRHWRGELSLAVSYWINCVAVSAVLGIVGTESIHAAHTSDRFLDAPRLAASQCVLLGC